MNAYELADKLWEFHNAFNLGDVQCLIREQADKIKNMEIWEKKYLDRIEGLEKEKIRAYDNGYEDGQKSLQDQADRIAELEKENMKLNREVENLMDGRC